MVETTLPANIGSAARAMHTCALHQLILVNPKHPIDATSISHAKGGAHILEHTRIAPTLSIAVAKCQLVIAASSRSRHVPRPVISPKQLCTIIHAFAHSHDQPKIALVFGREDRGLTNDELALADYHVQIPANRAYPVLNVAASIQVLASFLYHHWHDLTTKPTQADRPFSDVPTNALTIRSDWDAPAITHDQKDALNHHLTALLTKLSLIDADQPKDLPKRLSRLTARLQLDQKEYALIRAVLAKLDQQIP